MFPSVQSRTEILFRREISIPMPRVLYLVGVTAHAHHAWQTKIEWFHREPGFFHESDQKAAETGIDMQRNTVLHSHLTTNRFGK